MPIIDLHHFQNHKKPYVLQYIRKDDGSLGTKFLKTNITKLSKDETYGDYSCNVNKEGFYQIGHTRKKDCGCRLFFVRNNQKKFRFVRDEEQIERIKELIINGVSISQIAEDLEL